ncbi:MAG: DUF4919 domain-containing protein [Alphaproteobacteria bacterium]|nr:DUF4919 domain-containing protein [Alphaproteobacteria bacterium]MBU0860015.1 DUF4919 domain-containing protein [Alphaproteobacteria bacterium]
MKNLLVLTFIAMICAFTPALAQEGAASTEAGPNIYDEQYYALVDQAFEMPEDFDFLKARELYVQTSFYEPFAMDPYAAFEDFMDRQRAQDSTVVREVSSYLYQHFAVPEAHLYSQSFFRRAQMPKPFKYHQWVEKGLLLAYGSTGDALSMERAMKPVVISEQYIVARKHGEVVEKRRERDGDKIYDVLLVKDPEAETVKTLWFDVTALHAARKRAAAE